MAFSAAGINYHFDGTIIELVHRSWTSENATKFHDKRERINKEPPAVQASDLHRLTQPTRNSSSKGGAKVSGAVS